MNTLLVLGSKPDPALPPRPSYDALACANASGYSAAKHGLPTPTYTVLSAILSSGIASGKQSLRALAGLETETLYFFPRPPAKRSGIKTALQLPKMLTMTPQYLRWRLRTLSYRYHHFVDFGWDYYSHLVTGLCDQDDRVMEQLARKQPSTGMIALAIGLGLRSYDRFILTGFSFELTHAYATNPEIEQRGTQGSRHADTDITVIGYWATKYGNIFTTEPIVAERTGIPLLADAPAAAELRAVGGCERR